ncbi:hypothetical protein LUZ60_009721 [Juncus effusus]|nr:hypothetical protein LUZ60_009721 [Juncus effusus]
MKLVFLFFLFPLSCLGQSNSISPNYNAIFSFGDSYADTGNLAIVASSVSRSELVYFPPYGVSFFPYPTGRCSDGRIVLDFIAEEFGLPFVKPYWKYNGSFIQGANFAVGGAAALDYEFYIENNITKAHISNTTLNVQLDWFEQLKPSLCSTPKQCKDYFARSLFFLGEIGGNDYLFMMMAGMSIEETRGYVPMIVETISKAAERLIENGARTIVIPGEAPGGCFPVSLAEDTKRPKSDYDPETGCLKEINERQSAYHNSELLKAVKKLRLKYPHVKLIYADYYRPVIDLIKSPKSYGFTETPLKACCGKGENQYNFNQSEVCGMPNVSFCQNPSSFVNWDGVHLTEGAYHHIATSWLKGPYADPPILPAQSTSKSLFSAR